MSTRDCFQYVAVIGVVDTNEDTVAAGIMDAGIEAVDTRVATFDPAQPFDLSSRRKTSEDNSI